MPFDHGAGSPILPEIDTYDFDAELDEPATTCGKIDGAFVEATFRRPCVCYIPGRGTATMVAPGRLMTTIDVGNSDTDFRGLHARFNFRGLLADQWVNVKLNPVDMFVMNSDVGYVLMACEVRAAAGQAFCLFIAPGTQAPALAVRFTCFLEDTKHSSLSLPASALRRASPFLTRLPNRFPGGMRA
jgi:hypothetical protein